LCQHIKIVAPFIDTLVKAFIYKRKNIGPSTEPWGIPDFISVHLGEKKIL
jgi:hypothetical protein